MTSLLSFFSSSLNAVDFYAQIYRDEEFVKLVNRNKDKSIPDIVKLVAHQLLHKTFDPYVEEVLEDEEITDIFNNENAEMEDRIKLFVGRAMLKIHEKFLKDNRRIVVDPEMLVGQAVIHILEYVDPENINSGADLYNGIINTVCDRMCVYLDPLMSYFMVHGGGPQYYYLFIEIVKKILKLVNGVLDYESPYVDDDDDDDDGDDDDDDGGDDGDDDDDDDDDDDGDVDAAVDEGAADGADKEETNNEEEKNEEKGNNRPNTRSRKRGRTNDNNNPNKKPRT